MTDRSDSSEMFNVCYSGTHTLLDIVENINQILDLSIELISGETRKGDVKHLLADISKDCSIRGYDPSVAFAEALNIYFEKQENTRAIL